MNRDKRDLSDLRQHYTVGVLDETHVDADPIVQFNKWLEEAIATDIVEPNAMVLATSTKDQPNARVVLLKSIEEGKLLFYTNYLSSKGKEIALNDKVALVFYWDILERQVRIQGKIEKISAQRSDDYFAKRPLGSRIGAMASPQSSRIEDRDGLEAEFKRLEEGDESAISRPDNWGGYAVSPQRFEFWQGRESRLHDRLVYERNTNGKWQIHRLAP